MIMIKKAGLLTSIQDTGRSGYLRDGLPAAGCMDHYSQALANALVGNARDAAVIEVTLIGPELYFDAPAVVGIAGADFAITLNDQPVNTMQTLLVPAQSTLRFLSLRAGCRAYIAIAGGLDIPCILGSQSSYTPAKIGANQGKVLAKGDVLGLLNDECSTLAEPPMIRTIPKTLRIQYPSQCVLRVVEGSEFDQFTAASQQAFFEMVFTVSTQSSRMGYRLQASQSSQSLGIQRRNNDEMITTGLVPASIQITTEGDPIITMADGQTSGGYPRIANVIQADRHLLGQLKPGDSIRFYPVSLQKAISLYREKHQWITQHLFPVV